MMSSWRTQPTAQIKWLCHACLIRDKIFITSIGLLKTKHLKEIIITVIISIHKILKKRYWRKHSRRDFIHFTAVRIGFGIHNWQMEPQSIYIFIGTSAKRQNITVYCNYINVILYYTNWYGKLYQRRWIAVLVWIYLVIMRYEYNFIL